VPFGCTVEHGTCTAWIQLTGELDLATAPILQWHLRDALAHARMVVLDLRQLSFMDAAGLHVICDASESAEAQDRRLVLVRGPAQVDRVFTLTGLSEKLYMVDVAELDGNLAPAQAPPGVRGAVAAVQTTVGAKVALTGPHRTSHANSESTPQIFQTPRFFSAPELTPERDGEA
jgi:anti-anti-sigma factor